MEHYTQEEEEKENVELIPQESSGLLKLCLRTYALMTMITLVTLEERKNDGVRTGVEKDQNVSMEKIPSFVAQAIEDFKKNNPDIKVTPQITIEGGKDVVIDLAQIHFDPKLRTKADYIASPDYEACLKCQKNIQTFTTNMLQVASQNDSEVYFFSEGETDKWKKSNDVAGFNYANGLALALLSEINLTEEEFNIGLKSMTDNFVPSVHESLKYSIYLKARDIINSRNDVDELKKVSALNTINEKIESIDSELVLYAGGMKKLGIEQKIYLNTTEDPSLLDVGTAIIATGQNVMSALNANNENREDFAVNSILKKMDSTDNKSQIAVIDFGAAHDLYKNLEGKGVTLIRINMIPKETRDKYLIVE